MTSRVNLDSVVGMLRRAERFDELPAAQQAALRAQVTRTLNVVSDPDIEDVAGNKMLLVMWTRLCTRRITTKAQAKISVHWLTEPST